MTTTLSNTKVLELLRARQGRYITHDSEHYQMKEADGSDVVMRDRSGRQYAVEPLPEMIDDLIAAQYLHRHGRVYRLA
jgi:hypothetical protein